MLAALAALLACCLATVGLGITSQCTVLQQLPADFGIERIFCSADFSAACRGCIVCCIMPFRQYAPVSDETPFVAPPCAQPAGGAAPPPMLQMAQAALRLPPVLGGNSSSEGSADAGPSGLLVGVRLVGAAQRPVSADLALELPQGEAPLAPAGAGRRAGKGSAAAAWAPADPAQLWLDPAQLRWDAGDAGIKWTRLRSTTDLPLTLVFEGSGSDGSGGSADVTAASLPGGQAVLRVRLAGASGASIAAAPLNATDMLLDAGNRSSNGSAGGQGSASLPMFGFIANQVAYPPSNSSGQSSSGNINSSAGQAAIPVRLLAGRLGGAATLRYTLRLLQPDVPRGLQAPPQFLPARALQGFLRFTPAPAGSGGGSGSNMGAAVEQQILLPLAWDRIPAEAEYHLGGSYPLQGHAGTVLSGGACSQEAAVNSCLCWLECWTRPQLNRHSAVPSLPAAHLPADAVVRPAPRRRDGAGKRVWCSCGAAARRSGSARVWHARGVLPPRRRAACVAQQQHHRRRRSAAQRAW